jgi:hypothetical protein
MTTGNASASSHASVFGMSAHVHQDDRAWTRGRQDAVGDGLELTSADEVDGGAKAGCVRPMCRRVGGTQEKARSPDEAARRSLSTYLRSSHQPPR